MCGEMAGDALYTRLLLGMGLDEFSMHPNALAEVKQVILNSNTESLSPQVETLLNSVSHDQFQKRLEQFQQH